MSASRPPSKREGDRDTPQTDAKDNGTARLRALFAEFLGTWALTFVAAGVAVVDASLGGVPPAWQGLAPGLLVMVMIYSLGEVSGAHFNPAVTLSFALRRDFPWARVPGYWLAQIAGSLLAAFMLYDIFGKVGHVGATLPHHGVVASLLMEIVLTFILLTVILATATEQRIVGPNAAIAVGFTIALDGILGVPVSGASMNVARSFGPALFAGKLDTFWIYLVASFTASLLAVAAAWLLRGPGSTQARETATGDQ